MTSVRDSAFARALPKSLAILGLSLLAFSGTLWSPLQGAHGFDGTEAPSCREVPQANGSLLLDCRPGFHTDHDLVVIYPADSPVDATAVRAFADSIWLFDVGADGRANLIIEFYRDEGHAVADLFDDRDGDGAVSYLIVDGKPRPIESRHPSMRVVSRDGWWVKDGKTSFNLDIFVDGPVRATFGSNLGEGAEYYRRLAHDGEPDYRIHVRDTARAGSPDLEWRQFYPPFPESPALSSHYRTEIVRNPEGDEVPIEGSILWPYLGRQAVESARDYAKGYGESPPPIRVDWERGRIAQVSEFVASRGNPGSFFIYSINRVEEGTTTATNFENPFAFYDFAEANDGWPDTSIRLVTTLPNEAPTIANVDPINVVQYSWDQFHRHNWTYSVNLVGSQPIDQIIEFPEFAVRAIPPDDLPDWVARQQWNAATFVEVNIPTYWTSERVYEYSVQGESDLLPFLYMTGLVPDPPTFMFERIQPGFRGEYVLDMDGPVRLYLSPVDRRLHLLGATGGVWNLGDDWGLRYGSLGSQYISHWVLEESDRRVAELYVAADQVIHASERGVLIGQLDGLREPTLVTPPRNHEEWTALGDMLREQEADFAPDDLRAMFRALATAVTWLPNASVINLRLTEAGFELVLDLPAIPTGIAWAAGSEAGIYLVEYRQGVGYSMRRPESAKLELTAPAPIGSLHANAESQLSLSVSNSGDLDAPGVEVVAYAAREGAPLEAIASSTIDVPAGESREVRFTWTPPVAGRWLVEAAVVGSSSARSRAAVIIEGGPDAGIAGTLAAQGAPQALLAAAVLLLSAGALLAGEIAAGARRSSRSEVGRRRAG